jgi:30S ribosomal protein S31
MGKGDRKSKKGKIFRKSHGKTRPKRNTLVKAKALRKRQAVE